MVLARAAGRGHGDPAVIWLRRSVVLCLGCTVGLLLYCAWRVIEGGATASLLCGAAVASRLGCSEVTAVIEPLGTATPRSLRRWVFTTLRLLVLRCTSSAALSTSFSAPPRPRKKPAASGNHGAAAGAAAPIPSTSKLDDLKAHARDA